MKITIGNLYSTVDATDEERSWLHDCDDLCFNERKFNPWERKYVTKQVRFYNIAADKFPTGRIRKVIEAAKAKGFKVELADARVKPCSPDPSQSLEWLRHHPMATVDPITHQIEAVETIHKRTRGIIKVPTGGGKTEIAIGLMKSLRCRWLFLVHRSDLLDQTAKRFELRTGERAECFGAGSKAGARVTVALFQAFHVALKSGDPLAKSLLAEAEGVIVDECHTLGAETFWDVTMNTPKAYYRVGLSGTPPPDAGSGDDRRGHLVTAALGLIQYEVSFKELERIGVVARPRIRFHVCRQKAMKPTWQGVYGENIIRSVTRNGLLLKLATKGTKPCLLFVQQLAHGRNLLKLLTKKGLRAEFISGKEELPMRRAAVERLERRDIDVLVVNVIFQEGVDIPHLRSVVMGTGGASPTAALQRLGRGARRVTGKEVFEVEEIADRGCGCNRKTKKEDPANYHPGCQWLDRHTNERIKAYRDEGHDVEIVEEDQLFPVPKTGT